MTPIYMPFTYLPASMAHVLAALVGPVVVYQPLASCVSDSLTVLAEQGLVEIRTPLTGDERRLKTALREFTQWAAQNPGRSTPGAGFVGTQQGKVPFFDETAISRIRSDIQQYGSRPAATDHRETGFSARLFLAVAQENDRTTANLDQNLEQFKALEQGFLDALVDSDNANFSRHALGSQLWKEDPGAKHTEQRIRAWATLAAADSELPDLLITTSGAVMDTLVDTRGEAIHLERLAAIRSPLLSAGPSPLLEQVLADLALRQSLTAADCEAFTALGDDGPGDSTVAVTLFAATDCPPSSVIRQLAPADVTVTEQLPSQESPRHALIVMVEAGSRSD